MRHMLPLMVALTLVVGLSVSPRCAAQSALTSKAVHDGSSIANAVVIHADDDGAAIKAEDRWLVKHYPAFRKVQQALIAKNGHHYDAIKIQGVDGTEKTIYFDISKAFDSLLKLFDNAH